MESRHTRLTVALGRHAPRVRRWFVVNAVVLWATLATDAVAILIDPPSMITADPGDFGYGRAEGPASVLSTLGDLASYFTTWSLLVAAVVTTLLAIDPGRDGRVLRAARLASVLMLTVTVVATAGAKNDTTTSDNTATGTTALVDAVNAKVDQPAGSLGHINLKTLSGVTAPAGSTFGPNPSNPGTCGSIRIDPATGMASLIVPTEGSCTVTYQICAPAPNASQCDAATVTVNAWTPVSVPTLGEWARAALGLLLAVFGAAMSLRQHRA